MVYFPLSTCVLDHACQAHFVEVFRGRVELEPEPVHHVTLGLERGHSVLAFHLLQEINEPSTSLVGAVSHTLTQLKHHQAMDRDHVLVKTVLMQRKLAPATPGLVTGAKVQPAIATGQRRSFTSNSHSGKILFNFSTM